MSDLMKGKRGLIMGVANDHSIAWGIAKAVAAQGAELAFSYQGEAFGRRVKPLADSVGAKLLLLRAWCCPEIRVHVLPTQRVVLALVTVLRTLRRTACRIGASQ